MAQYSLSSAIILAWVLSGAASLMASDVTANQVDVRDDWPLELNQLLEPSGDQRPAVIVRAGERDILFWVDSRSGASELWASEIRDEPNGLQSIVGRPLGTFDSNARYLAGAWLDEADAIVLVWQAGAALRAQSLDAATLELSGKADHGVAEVAPFSPFDLACRGALCLVVWENSDPYGTAEMLSEIPTQRTVEAARLHLQDGQLTQDALALPDPLTNECRASPVTGVLGETFMIAWQRWIPGQEDLPGCVVEAVGIPNGGDGSRALPHCLADNDGETSAALSLVELEDSVAMIWPEPGELPDEMFAEDRVPGRFRTIWVSDDDGELQGIESAVAQLPWGNQWFKDFSATAVDSTLVVSWGVVIEHGGDNSWNTCGFGAWRLGGPSSVLPDSAIALGDLPGDVCGVFAPIAAVGSRAAQLIWYFESPTLVGAWIDPVAAKAESFVPVIASPTSIRLRQVACAGGSVCVVSYDESAGLETRSGLSRFALGNGAQLDTAPTKLARGAGDWLSVNSSGFYFADARHWEVPCDGVEEDVEWECGESEWYQYVHLSRMGVDATEPTLFGSFEEIDETGTDPRDATVFCSEDTCLLAWHADGGASGVVFDSQSAEVLAGISRLYEVGSMEGSLALTGSKRSFDASWISSADNVEQIRSVRLEIDESGLSSSQSTVIAQGDGFEELRSAMADGTAMLAWLACSDAHGDCAYRQANWAVKTRSSSLEALPDAASWAPYNGSVEGLFVVAMDDHFGLVMLTQRPSGQRLELVRVGRDGAAIDDAPIDLAQLAALPSGAEPPRVSASRIDSDEVLVCYDGEAALNGLAVAQIRCLSYLDPLRSEVPPSQCGCGTVGARMPEAWSWLRILSLLFAELF